MFRRISLLATVTGVGGYWYLHRQLGEKYPDIRPYDLPKESRITSLLNNQHKHGDNYIAYCDTFKATVQTPLSKEQVASKILSHPTLGLVSSADGVSTLGAFQKCQSSVKSTRVSHSTILPWTWSSPKFVAFFEMLAEYGYPWRLMNGGFHEVLVVALGNNTYDVYFASAHEYKDLRDGKLLPRFAQLLHRDYARLVLDLATK